MDFIEISKHYFLDENDNLVRRPHKTCKENRVVTSDKFKFCGKYYRTNYFIEYLKTGKTDKTNFCKECGSKFEYQNSSKLFCTKDCGVKWRTKNIYHYKYSHKCRSSTPYNFLKTLLQKKGSKRQQLHIDYIMKLWEEQRGICAITGIPMTHLAGHGRQHTNVSLDRIDPDGGYVEGNIQLVTCAANQIKGRLSMEELYTVCHKILENAPRKGSLNNSRTRVVSKAYNRSKQPKRS